MCVCVCVEWGGEGAHGTYVDSNPWPVLCIEYET